MRLHGLGLRVLATVLLAYMVSAAPVWANVYASGIGSVSPSTISYILNDNADSVTMEVWEVGGGMVYSEDQGALLKGSHPWTWNGSGYQSGKTYHVAITAHAPGYSGWTKISTDGVPTSFRSPAGVSVNQMQASPNFGKIYVSEAQGGAAGYGRTTTAGIYMLNADGTEAGFADGGVTWAGGYAPWKSTIGPDGHLYVADYTNDRAYEFNDDMVATQLTDASNRTTGQMVESIWVSGTGANRVIYLVNSNPSSAAGSRRGVIAYDIGENATVTPGDLGTQYLGPGYFARAPRDVARDSQGNWYVCQNSTINGVVPPITKFTDSATLPINDPEWEASMNYTGAYGIDIYEPYDWVAYADNSTGWVRIFSTTNGSYVGGFDAGDFLRDVAFDAAGNIVTVDSNLHLVRTWSPNGENVFTTNSLLEIVPEPSSLLALAACLPVLWFRRRS